MHIGFNAGDLEWMRVISNNILLRVRFLNAGEFTYMLSFWFLDQTKRDILELTITWETRK